MTDQNSPSVASDTTKVRTAQTFENMQPGTVIRNAGSGNTYIVTENYGSYAVAVRTVCIFNLPEWEIVGKPEKTEYGVCKMCGFEIGFDFLSGRWQHTKTNPRHPAVPK